MQKVRTCVGQDVIMQADNHLEGNITALHAQFRISQMFIATSTTTGEEG